MNTNSATAARRRGLGRLCLSAWCMDGGFFLIMAALPWKILSLGGGPVAVGAAPAIGAVVYIAGTLWAGRRSDRGGRGLLCLTGGLLQLLFAVLAWLADDVVTLLLLSPLLGAGKALYWPVAEAAVGDLSGANRLQRNVALFNSSWCGGKTTGFFALGVLLAAGDFRLVFLCGGLLAVAAFVALPGRRLLDGSTAPTATDAPAETPNELPAGRRRLFRRLAWTANTSANAAAVIFATHLPAWFDAHGWSEGRFGAFLGSIFLSQTATFLVLSRRRVFSFTLGPLVGPQVAVVAVAAVVPWLTDYRLLLAAAPLLGVSFGLCYAASLYYSLHTLVGRGRHAGIHEALIGFGGFLPPLAAGVLAAATGHPGSPALLAALIAATALGWQLLVAGRSKDETKARTCS